jgi:hypothetical protein
LEKQNMKKLLLTLLAVVAVPAAYAQGSFNANNYTSGNVYVGTVGGQLAGSDYFVQVFTGPLGTLEANLTPLGPVSALFGTTGGALGSGAGWFDLGTLDALPGNPGPTPNQVLVQIRGTGPGGVTGRSPVITQNVVFTPTPSGDLGFTGDWAIVPEPSTLTLAGLGAVALLGLRRRK